MQHLSREAPKTHNFAIIWSCWEDLSSPLENRWPSRDKLALQQYHAACMHFYTLAGSPSPLEKNKQVTRETLKHKIGCYKSVQNTQSSFFNQVFRWNLGIRLAMLVVGRASVNWNCDTFFFTPFTWNLFLISASVPISLMLSALNSRFIVPWFWSIRLYNSPAQAQVLLTSLPHCPFLTLFKILPLSSRARMMHPHAQVCLQVRVYDHLGMVHTCVVHPRQPCYLLCYLDWLELFQL